MLEVKYQEELFEDLKIHLVEVRKRHGQGDADAFFDWIVNEANIIAEFPGIGPLVDQPNAPESMRSRRLYTWRKGKRSQRTSYVIFYSIMLDSDTGVEVISIDRVRDDRQRLLWSEKE